MIEELPDDIENDIDDIEPVGEEADAQLYEHFRVVVDKGQAMMRVDNICSSVLSMLRATVSRKLPKTVW